MDSACIARQRASCVNTPMCRCAWVYSQMIGKIRTTEITFVSPFCARTQPSRSDFREPW